MYTRLKLSDRKKDKEKLNHVKSEVCYAIKRIAMKNGWDQKTLAQHIGTSQSNMSRVIRLRLDDLTLYSNT